jgi:chromosome partitioning protein
MPTVVIASPKGGSGKSTSSVLLGTELAYAGIHTTIIDCDPNQSIQIWAQRKKLPERIHVDSTGESDVIKKIKKYDQDGSVVIVDLEGVASRLVSRAISQAELVLIPMRATTLDANIGAKALILIKEEEEALSRNIKSAVVFTMTRAIVSRQHNEIEESLKNQNVDIINPSLMERSAYSALFQFGGGLRDMPAQGNMENAIINAAQFSESVYNRLIC